MEIIQKATRTSFPNSDTCTAYEYKTSNSKTNGAVIAINGRYPEKGWAYNEECTELAFVTKGCITLTISEGDHVLNEEDMAILSPMEKFFWTGQGEFLTVCTPAWQPEQHKLVD